MVNIKDKERILKAARENNNNNKKQNTKNHIQGNQHKAIR